MTDPYHAPLGLILYLSQPAPCDKCGSLTRYLFVARLTDEMSGDVARSVRLCLDDLQGYLVYAAEVLSIREGGPTPD